MARRPEFWELLTCSWRGHVLVGVDAACVARDDDLYVREFSGLRWHRCLRCDAWLPRLPPLNPTTDTVPKRADIILPARGTRLRDRYVLRLIAIDRAVHVILLAAIAFALFFIAGHQVSLEKSYDQIMNSLLGSAGGPAALRGLIGKLHKFFVFTPAHLYELGIVACAYAALEAAEMVGLWLMKRWAEYLTFVATALLLPLEIDELAHGVSALKLVVFVVNLAVAIYLLFAKRLFGLRGGHHADEVEDRASGWSALEAATPSPRPPPTRRANAHRESANADTLSPQVTLPARSKSD